MRFCLILLVAGNICGQKIDPAQLAVRKQIEANNTMLQRYSFTWQMEIAPLTEEGWAMSAARLQFSWEIRDKKPCLFGVFEESTDCLKGSESGELPFEAAKMILARPATSVEPTTLPDGGLGYAMTFLPLPISGSSALEKCRNSATVRVLTDALTSRLVLSEVNIVSEGCATKRGTTQPLLAPGSTMVTRYLTDGDVNVPMETEEQLVRFPKGGGTQIWFGQRLPYDEDDPYLIARVSIRLLAYERRSVLRVNPEI